MALNLGGDLVHLGAGRLVVGIEHPQRAYDNAEPFVKVAITGQGLATSGSARRGVRIGQHWYSHVIDPRTGWPVNRVASASVIAPEATTADAAATLLSVVTSAEGLALVEHWDLATPGCCTVDRAGSVLTNSQWDRQVV